VTGIEYHAQALVQSIPGIQEDIRSHQPRRRLRQQLIPYFISSHPGCKEEDMAELAVITKRLDFHLEQCKTLPHPHDRSH
jgi:hypothetical protein